MSRVPPCRDAAVRASSRLLGVEVTLRHHLLCAEPQLATASNNVTRARTEVNISREIPRSSMPVRCLAADLRVGVVPGAQDCRTCSFVASCAGEKPGRRGPAALGVVAMSLLAEQRRDLIVDT